MNQTKDTKIAKRNVALCYIRLSLTRDESDLDSPERQRANILAVCQKHGWLPEWYEDTDGHRSGTKEKNRPGWLSLKARLSDPDVAAVVANDLARLHRKGWRVGSLLDFLDEHGVGLVLAAPGRDFDFTGPQGRMLIMIIAMMDEWYALDTSQRQKDSIRYRRSRGIPVGRIPFGTIRGSDGYLKRSPFGVWLMPDSSVIEGTQANCPTEGATFRGYFEATVVIMRLYAENRYGRRKIAALINAEGYWFRDHTGQPRQFDDECVRAITANWPAYGGISLPGKATGRKATDLTPQQVKLDPERAVVDIELCYRVAQVRLERYREKQHTVQLQSYVYPLVGIAYCAHCAQLDQHSKLQGYEAYRAHPRYRHGDQKQRCASKNRSVKAEILDGEFARLVESLVVKPEVASEMAEAFYKANKARNTEDRRAEILAEINLCKQRIKNAEVLFLQARLDQEALNRHIVENEDEIARLQVELSESSQIREMIELSIQMLSEIGGKWEQAVNEEKQAFAQSLFSEIIFDLDIHQIVGFKLKPWVEPFLQVQVSRLACLEGFEPPTSCSVGKRSIR